MSTFLYTSRSGCKSWQAYGARPPVFSWGTGVGLIAADCWSVKVGAASPGNHWRKAAESALASLAAGIEAAYDWSVLQDENGTFVLHFPRHCPPAPIIDAIDGLSKAAGGFFDPSDAWMNLAAQGFEHVVCDVSWGRVTWCPPEGDPMAAGTRQEVRLLRVGPSEGVTLPPREEGGEPRLRQEFTVNVYAHDYSPPTCQELTMTLPRGARWHGPVEEAPTPDIN